MRSSSKSKCSFLSDDFCVSKGRCFVISTATAINVIGSFLKKKTNDIAVGARMSDFVRSLCTENVVAVISP